jgi:hypothetical protein
MKKRDLEKELRKMAKENDCEFVIVGGATHDTFRFNGLLIAIPRHSELNKYTAREILKDCRATLNNDERGPS